MPSKSLRAIYWTDQALRTSLIIKEYLTKNFSETELEKFYSLLSDFERAVITFPQLYPKAKKTQIRRAILSKELSVFYRVLPKRIEVIAVLDNRSDIENRLK